MQITCAEFTDEVGEPNLSSLGGSLISVKTIRSE